MNDVKAGMKFRDKRDGETVEAVSQIGTAMNHWKCAVDGKLKYNNAGLWLENSEVYEPIAPTPRVPKVGETWIKPAGTNEPRKLKQWEALQVEAQMSDGAVWTYVSGPDDAQAAAIPPARRKCGRPGCTQEAKAELNYCGPRCSYWPNEMSAERGPSAVASAKTREPWVDSLPWDWWLPDA